MQSAPYAPPKRTSAKRPADGWSSLSLVKTGTPGIFRKPGAKARPYVVVYRAVGKQRKESCRRMAEARAIKAARETDDLRGDFQARSKITLRAALPDAAAAAATPTPRSPTASAPSGSARDRQARRADPP